MRAVRQIRQYAAEPVPEDVVKQLLQVARWTGSSRNTQPWHFVVVTDKEQLRKISQLRAPINWLAGGACRDRDRAGRRAVDERGV